jgi:hypothetical protein
VGTVLQTLIHTHRPAIRRPGDRGTQLAILKWRLLFCEHDEFFYRANPRFPASLPVFSHAGKFSRRHTPVG